MSQADRIGTLLDLSRFDEALDLANRDLATNPDDVQVLQLQAFALIGLRRPKDAIPSARRAVALAPDDPWSLRSLGRAYYLSGKPDAAIAPLERAVMLAPNVAIFHAAMVEALTRAAPKHNLWKRRELIARARQHAEEARRLEPRSALGYQMCSKAALADKNLDEAEGWARQALEIDPNDALSHQLMGIVARDRGDRRAAGDHFVEAGRLNPRSESSSALLRGLQVGGTFGGIGLVIVVQSIVRSGSSLGVSAVIALLVLVVAAVVSVQLIGRATARRQLSDQARHALAQHRKMKPRWWRRG